MRALFIGGTIDNSEMPAFGGVEQSAESPGGLG